MVIKTQQSLCQIPQMNVSFAERAFAIPFALATGFNKHALVVFASVTPPIVSRKILGGKIAEIFWQFSYESGYPGFYDVSLDQEVQHDNH